MGRNQNSTADKDPLAGDVDKFVNPDETRTDNEAVRDEQISARLHRSGDDGADEYWAEYSELHGEDSSDDKSANTEPAEDDDEDKFGQMIMANIEKRKRERGYDPELDDEEKDEDPLAGDVDRWVHPDETQD